MMDRGVDVATKDYDGLKPVDLAKQNNHEEAYQLLFRVAKSSLLVRLCRLGRGRFRKFFEGGSRVNML